MQQTPVQEELSYDVSGVRVIVNADDLGMTPGINHAIREAFRREALTHASIVVNGPCFDHALDEVVPACPGLGVGLHVNLLSGDPASPAGEIPLLVNGAGRFANSFLSLWFRSAGGNSAEFLGQVRREIEAQIVKARERGLPLTHLDGHEHCHTIPAIHRVVVPLAAQYGIPRIREIRESLFQTLRVVRCWDCVPSLNLAKHLLLTHFFRVNGRDSGRCFLSILCACRFRPDRFRAWAAPPGCKEVEIVLHPGDPEIDRDAVIERAADRRTYLSAYRTEEYQTCLRLRELLGRPSVRPIRPHGTA